MVDRSCPAGSDTCLLRKLLEVRLTARKNYIVAETKTEARGRHKFEHISSECDRSRCSVRSSPSRMQRGCTKHPFGVFHELWQNLFLAQITCEDILV